jgi:hypothetical protein
LSVYLAAFVHKIGLVREFVLGFRRYSGYDIKYEKIVHSGNPAKRMPRTVLSRDGAE